MAAAAVTKNRKNPPYLNNGLTDHREFCAVTHIGTLTHIFFPYRQLKIRPFKNPRWCTTSVLTIEKSRHVDKGLTDRDDLTLTHLNPD